MKGIILSFISTAILILLHIIVIQLFKPRKMFETLLFIYFLSAVAYTLFYVTSPSELYVFSKSWYERATVLDFLNGLFVQLLLFFNYVQILYYLTRPVTLRILMEFLSAPDSRLSISELNEKYRVHEMIRSRLELLLMHGYVKSESGRYQLKKKGRYMVNACLFLRRLFGIPYYLDSVSPMKKD